MDNIKQFFKDLKPSELVALPIILIENYKDNMRDEMEIKGFYKNIIISNIIFFILSIILKKSQITFYYSLGCLGLILLTLKTFHNEMHERAFMKIWKRFKDADFREIRSKFLLSSRRYDNDSECGTGNTDNRTKYEDNVFVDLDDEDD